MVSQGDGSNESQSIHRGTVHFPSHPLAWDQHHPAQPHCRPPWWPGYGKKWKLKDVFRIRGLANGGGGAGRGRWSRTWRFLGNGQELGEQAGSL